MPRVLHLLTQRPSHTGSGMTLARLVELAEEDGWEQEVVVGTPADDPSPRVGPLDAARVHPLLFGRGGLDFALPGMSDVMPYPSSRFGALDPGQLARYREAWRAHLSAVLAAFQPELIHAHHLWIVGALLKDLAPETPIVSHCHGTDLRQLRLVPRLADEVRRGCARNDRFLALHGQQVREIQRELGVPAGRVRAVGVGYAEELFVDGGDPASRAGQLLYVGKYSAAKGLPSLLDAFARLQREARGPLVLHVAGGGSGPEAESLRARMQAMAPAVVLHGQLAQGELSALMQRCAVCVLPSLFEGLPLVLVEAAACGCRLVATDLPGVVGELQPVLGDTLHLVRMPALRGVDSAVEEALPAFAQRLARALHDSLRDSAAPPPAAIRRRIQDSFTWRAVFARVGAVWRELVS